MMINRLFIFLSVMLLLSCEEKDDVGQLEIINQPIRFDISIGDDVSQTRSDIVLPTTKKVYISTDEGETYYEYGYEGGMWKAFRKYNGTSWETSSGITWTSANMLIYAIARTDDTPMVKESPISILADQSTQANLNSSDFYGIVTPITYTNGSVELKLKHQVGRLKVSVSNCTAPNGMTCSIVQPQNTTGVITTGDDKITVTSQATPLAITMFREVTSSTTVNFYAHLFEKMAFGGPSKAECLVITDNGISYSVPVMTTGGISIDPGYTTLMNVTLKK